VVFLADPAGEWDHEPTLHVDRSGDKVRGYMAVYGPARGHGKPPLLAHPLDWDKLAKEERNFEEAEDHRLKYVAATRAGAALIISQRVKGNRYSPWVFFEDALTGCPAVADPGPIGAPATEEVTLTREQADAAFAEIARRWRTVSADSYAVVAAKQLAVTGKSAGSAGQEHGTEWGTVIHLLLQAAMEQPGSDLHSLARTALSDVDMPLDLAEEAVQTMQSEMDSDLWRRAMASSQRLVEVPFQVLLPADAAAGQPLPSVLRGVIDLCFWEDGGWVIVDHKTDAATDKDLRRLTDHYRPQVKLYAAAWQQVTGQPVREAGLYFVRAGQYVRC
jgi:ATP-dependent helicase/nuclease subunit A